MVRPAMQAPRPMSYHAPELPCRSLAARKEEHSWLSWLRWLHDPTSGTVRRA